MPKYRISWLVNGVVWARDVWTSKECARIQADVISLGYTPKITLNTASKPVNPALRDTPHRHLPETRFTPG